MVGPRDASVVGEHQPHVTGHNVTTLKSAASGIRRRYHSHCIANIRPTETDTEKRVSLPQGRNDNYGVIVNPSADCACSFRLCETERPALAKASHLLLTPSESGLLLRTRHFAEDAARFGLSLPVLSASFGMERQLQCVLRLWS